MALVVMCGLPASGKTTFARLLEQSLLHDARTVVIVTDGGNALDDTAVTSAPARSVMYATSAAEKKTRAELRTRTLRALQPDRVVVCDSLNYIKGFRYELYCAAREAGAAYCVVWTTSTVDECIRRDTTRVEGYGEKLVKELSMRFEAPRGQNRWDSPLHEVDAFSEDANTQAERVVASVRPGSKQLVPTVATRRKAKPGSDAFGTIDRLTRAGEAAVLADIRSGAGAGAHVVVPGASKRVFLAREVKASELRSFRRAHLNLVRMHPPNDMREEGVMDGYVDFVNAQLRTS